MIQYIALCKTMCVSISPSGLSAGCVCVCACVAQRWAAVLSAQEEEEDE